MGYRPPHQAETATNKTLRERIVLAAFDACRDDDPFITIAIGPSEVRIIWDDKQ